MSSGARYKFQGSQFSVQTGLAGSSPSPAITGITKADPAVVSSTANPHVDGDVIRIKGVVGMTEVNNRLFVVDNRLANSYELAGEDSTNSAAYVSGGYVDEAQFSEFCELTGMNQQDGASDEIDATTICSTAKEFELGLSDSGTLQLDYNFAPNATVMTALRAAKLSGDEIGFKIVFPNSGGTVIMLGKVQQTSFQGAVSGLWTGSATIKLSGEIFVLAA